MSAFNTLILNSNCGNCHQETQIKIQFKFGDTWQYNYFINQELRWGGNDNGKKGFKRVVLDGAGEPCEICKGEVDYLIFVEHNVIKSVDVNYGQYDFTNSVGYYLVLES